LLQISNWKVAVRIVEGWRKEIGEAMDLKQAEAPNNNNNNVFIPSITDKISTLKAYIILNRDY
jgi:hypothetical protein